MGNGHISAEIRLQISTTHISVLGGSSDAATRFNGSVGSVNTSAITQSTRSESVYGRTSGRRKNKIQNPSNEAAKIATEKEM
jgi:hypothetical protein